MYGALISPAMIMCGFTTHEFSCVADLEDVGCAVAARLGSNTS